MLGRNGYWMMRGRSRQIHKRGKASVVRDQGSEKPRRISALQAGQPAPHKNRGQGSEKAGVLGHRGAVAAGVGAGEVYFSFFVSFYGFALAYGV